MADDPFRRPAATQGNGGIDPRYDTGFGHPETFERANETARQRDVSQDRTTDPARDQNQYARADEPKAAREGAFAGADPLLDRNDRSAMQTVSGGQDRTDSVGINTDPFQRYEALRQRLDAVGARNWKFDKDPSTGVSTFTCEIPNPEKPSLLRVFEARSSDELKAMLAVVEQVERWAASMPRGT